MQTIYPFTAIVGQKRMKRALILNAVDTRIGGVLIRGERGTAKSTAARALAELLPHVKVVSDCRFGCHPDTPMNWCTECRERVDKGEELPFEVRQTSFINLPVSATEDRVVGTLDIEEAIKKGERRFESGVLAAANRGLLYIDEVNLLDDHVVDILLDSAAMGTNIVEREGISFSHPARFILVGTMNPEEGDLRPQLLDRFGLSVDIHGLSDARERVEIMERRLAFEADPEAFRVAWEQSEHELSEQIKRGRELVDQVTYTSRNLVTIASLTSSLHVDGHRADLVILKAARAQAAFDGRVAVNDMDIAIASELALPHRMKRGPFESSGIGMEELRERIDELQGQMQPDPNAKSEPQPGAGGEERESQKVNETDFDNNLPTDGDPEPGNDGNVFADTDSDWWDGGRRVQTGATFDTRRLDTPLDKIVRKSMGRRSHSKTEQKRGRYVQARPANGKTHDLAFDATLRAAAPFQRQRAADNRPVAFDIRSGDLMRKVRVRRSANLVLFVVDGSWSMAVAERMTATKGAILSLLTDAYQRRDRVGLIVFQKNKATTVLPPTNSVVLAQRALADIPVGGKTPLSAGLQASYELVQREKILHPDVVPLVIILTDGAGNVSMGNMPPQDEANFVAERIAEEKIHCVVVNMEHEAFDQGLACELAKHLESPCYTLGQLHAESLYNTVREELGVVPGSAAA